VDYIIEQMQQMGVWEFLRRYPVNPITVVAGAVLLGILVLVVVYGARRRKARQYRFETADAALMLYPPQGAGWGANIKIARLNGETAHWFFAKPAVPALYLRPGENRLELHAEWASGSAPFVKMHRSDQVTLTLDVRPEGRYLLLYSVEEARYIFEPTDFAESTPSSISTKGRMGPVKGSPR